MFNNKHISNKKRINLMLKNVYFGKVTNLILNSELNYYHDNMINRFSKAFINKKKINSSLYLIEYPKCKESKLLIIEKIKWQMNAPTYKNIILTTVETTNQYM